MAMAEILPEFEPILPLDVVDRLYATAANPLVEVASSSVLTGTTTRHSNEVADRALLIRETAVLCLSELLLGSAVPGVPLPRSGFDDASPNARLGHQLRGVVRARLAADVADWPAAVARAARSLRLTAQQLAVGRAVDDHGADEVGAQRMWDERHELIEAFVARNDLPNAVTWCAVVLHEELMPSGLKISAREELMLIAAAGGCAISHGRHRALRRAFQGNIAPA